MTEKRMTPEEVKASWREIVAEIPDVPRRDPGLRLAYIARRKIIGTQERVAALLRVDPSTICRREKGDVEVTYEHLYALEYLILHGYRRRKKNLLAKEG